MNLYNAIMKAADHIERHPNDFNFMQWCVPGSCGSPGCALGWIGFFAGLSGDAGSVALAMGMDPISAGHQSHRADMVFYGRMYALYPGEHCGSWKNLNVLPTALRAYAERYHSHEKAPALHPGFVKLRGDLNELQAGVMLEAT